MTQEPEFVRANANDWVLHPAKPEYGGAVNIDLSPYQAQILVNALSDAAHFRHHGKGRCPWGTPHCKHGRRCEDCKQDSEEVAIYEAMAPQFVIIARTAA